MDYSYDYEKEKPPEYILAKVEVGGILLKKHLLV